MLINESWYTTARTGCGRSSRTSYGSETSTHTVTPGYSDLVKQGKRIPYTSHTHRFFNDSSPVGLWASVHNSTRNTGTAVSCFGGLTDLEFSDPDHLTICKNIALSKLRAQDVDLGMALATLGSTADLVHLGAVRLVTAGRYLRQGKVSSAARALGVNHTDWAYERAMKSRRSDKGKLLADKWLELQFGWSPIIEDVYGAADAAYLHLVKEPPFVSTKGFKVHTESLTRTSAGTWTDTTTGYKQVRTSVRLLAQVEDDFTWLRSSLGLNNPLMVIHDGIPFSFVADWFYPLGQSLRAIGATSGLKFVDGYQSIYTNQVQKRRLTTGSVYIFDDPMEHDITQLDYVRTKYSTFPTMSFPAINIGSLVPSVWKAVTSLALLKQIFH